MAAIGYVLGILLFARRRPPRRLSVSGTTLTVEQLIGRTILAIGYVTVSMCGVAAFALFFSTFTDSPLGATLGALAVLVASSLLFTLDAAVADRARICRPDTGWRSSTSSATRSCGATSSAACRCRPSTSWCSWRRLGQLHDQGRH